MTVGPRPPAPRGSLSLVLVSAILSAALASAGTAALLLATAPSTGSAASPGASQPAAAATTVATARPSAAALTRVDGSEAIAAVAAASEPSVVTISAAGGGLSQAGGTGIIVSADGLILTTSIAAPADVEYAVLLADEHETTATVVATDPDSGLVLLRAATAGLTPAALSRGGDLTVGQLVIAVGSPLGSFADTVTAGIVSSLGRSIDLPDPSTGTRVQLADLIQTDAAINAGSSGGPLLDAAGTVVGVIATSAADGQGIGFAIPIARALPLIARAGAGA